MLDEINKLREHLKNLYPIFDQFCENFCFEYATPSSIGRYPRIRVEQKTSNIKLWLDLWMEFDEQGRRFQVFNPYLPYELSAGVSIDFEDGTKYGYRYYRVFVKFSNRPFCNVEETLYKDLTEALDVLKKWKPSDIISKGKKLELGKRSQDPD